MENGERVIQNQDVSFCEDCANSDELEIFNTESLQDLLEFKWSEYGKTWHTRGFVIHALQLCILVYYVNAIYLANQLDYNPCTDPPACVTDNAQSYDIDDNISAWLLLPFLSYPTVYESLQIVKIGPADYLGDVGNYADTGYIFGSVAMSLMHIFFSPFHLASKIVMMVVILLSVVRTFKFLKIFDSFSPIITILTEVVFDLGKFLLLFTIVVALFSLIFGALGIGNSADDR